MRAVSAALGEPNQSYYPGDGIKYILCYRCGIVGPVSFESESRFCRDCNSKSFYSVFFKLDYSEILK